jgi:hypothetical protein
VRAGQGFGGRRREDAHWDYGRAAALIPCSAGKSLEIGQGARQHLLVEVERVDANPVAGRIERSDPCRLALD